MLEPFPTSFLLIGVTELGDKSRLTGFLLTSRYRAPIPIFAGMTLAYALLEGIAVLFRAGLVPFLPMDLIRWLAGLLFILLGVILLIGKGEEQAKIEKWMGRFKAGGPFLVSFSLIALSEFGDRTQLATATLAATYQSPLVVFVGVITVLAGLNAMTVWLGHKILKRLPRMWISIVSGILFITFGALLLAMPA